MEMHQVRYFLAVAEDLNFTRAAERCNVAQPSLSRAVKLLEEELGGPLFHRERSQTHLSELGHMVRPHLELVFKEQQATKELARSFTSLKKTRLKLGVMCTIAPVQVTELLGTVIARYPGVDLEISDRSGLQLQEELLNGELEVAIYCVQDMPLDERLHFIPLFREQMGIVLHPQHKLASQNAVRPTDLHGDRYLKRVNCEFNSVAGKIFDEQGVVDETVYSCERDDWILAMAAAGFGYAFMPESCARHSGVVVRKLIEPEFWREVNLVSVRGRPHSPAVGALVREAMRVKWFGKPALAIEAAARAA